MTDTLQSLPGNSANNKPVVLKGTPRNDVLHGSLGHTTFDGGLGNDIYYSKNAGDTIVEYAHEGNDTVYADTTFTLPTHVENLTLTGNSNTFGFGNNSNNILIGNRGNNRLSGGRGNDKLEGMAGNDLLLGGDGDDSLYGGDGNNSLHGGDGDDYIAGGSGSDTIITGEGKDTVAFTASDIREGSIDRLLDFNPTMDKLDLSGMRSLLTGSNANLSWSKMFVEKDPEVILQKDRPYLIFDTEQHTLAYSEAGSSSSTIFAKFDFVWLDASNIIG